MKICVYFIRKVNMREAARQRDQISISLFNRYIVWPNLKQHEALCSVAKPTPQLFRIQRFNKAWKWVSAVHQFEAAVIG